VSFRSSIFAALSVAATILVSAIFAPASAAVIIDRMGVAPYYPEACSPCLFGTNYQSFEPFTLASSASISQVDFLGFYQNSHSANLFEVSIWDASLSTKLFSTGFVGLTGDSPEPNFHPDYIGFLETIALPNWSIANGDYYLSIFGSPEFLWSGPQAAADGGIQCNIYNDPTHAACNTIGTDILSFRLSGSSSTSQVPEPVTLTMFGTGLTVAVVVRRRRRKSAKVA